MKWILSFPGSLASVSLACLCVAAPAAAQTQAAQRFDADTLLDATLATLEAQQAPTSAGPRMHPSLLALQRQMQGAATATPGAQASRSGAVPAGVTVQGPQVVNGRVLVEAFVKADADAAARQLEAAGADKISRHGNLISAWVPVAGLGQMSQATQIQSVRPALGRVLHSGRAVTQGDSAQRSDVARQLFGLNGQGTAVGILSDSWNVLGGAAAGVATGELPGPGNPEGFTAPVQVLKDGEGIGNTDEGRGMAEIVHDVAPGAALAFYAPQTYLDHADGVRALAQAGATVVVDDIGWFGEPWFQHSPIGTAATQVAREHGTVVFSSAGNQNRDALEGAFNPAPAKALLANGQDAGNWKLHRFANGEVTVPITFKAGSNITLVLQWDEPFASASPPGVGARSDLDIFLFSDKQGVNIAFSGTDNSIGNDAVDGIFGLGIKPTDPNATMTMYLGVGARESLPGQARNFKLLAFDNGRTDIGRGTVFNSSTILGHANEDSIIASCAVRYDQANGGALATPEPFSSVGGFSRTISADGTPRAPVDSRKPDVCSPDGGNTSFFGRDVDGDGLPNFFGTSASAPHAAAVAALMQQAGGGPRQLNPQRIKDILRSTAFEMDDPATPGFQFGYDTKTGSGFVNTIRAIQTARHSAVQ